MTRSCGVRGLSLVLVALLIGIVSGCGESVGNVSGEVKLKDKPLPEGTISFVTKSRTKKVVTDSIRNGKYAVKGVPVGEATVIIQVTVPPPPKGKDLKGKAPQKVVTIPSKYADPSKSGLTYTVTTGDQTKDFILEPDAPASKGK